MSAKTKKAIDDALPMLFIKDLQPFSIVEDEGFRELVKALNACYQLPSRHSISNTIYEACVVQMKEKINEGSKFCITTDCWTSRSTVSFIAITAHFVNAQFDLCSILLECSPMTELHTSTNLSAELIIVTEEWGISNKISLAVSDNAKNITNAIEKELKWRHFGCFAHTLNLIVKDSLGNEVVCTLLQKVKQIVAHFKKSTTASEQFLAFQRNADKQPIKLIQSVEIRWNSTLDMIERFIRVEDAVKSTIALIKKDLPIITSDEWQLLQHLLSVLKPFEHATKEISGQKYCTASMVIPIANGLFQVLRELSDGNKYPEVVKTVLFSLLKGLNERLANSENSNTLTMATFLDPHFKNFAFSDLRIADVVKKCLIADVSREIQNQNNGQCQQNEVQKPSVPQLSIWSKLDLNISINKPKRTTTSRAIIEVQRYFEDDRRFVSMVENK